MFPKIVLICIRHHNRLNTILFPEVLKAELSSREDMNIAIDIWHPSDIHFFKNFIAIMKEKGHKILVTSRKKDIITDLLDSYKIEHVVASRKGEGFFGLARELLEHNYKLFKAARKFKPDIFLAFGGMSISHVGTLMRKPSISFYDTEHASLIKFVTLPFITKVCTPECYLDNYGKKQIRFKAYKEMAHLTPKYFTPDPSILETLGVKKGEPYFLIRYISWNASHDIGVNGLSDQAKIKLVEMLEKHGKVFVSAEENIIPKEIADRVIKIDPKKYFDILHFAKMVITEGETTATEAVLLGTPAVYANPLLTGVMKEQIEKYKIVEHAVGQKAVFAKVQEMLENKGLQENLEKKRDQLLADKIDLTKWMVEYVSSFDVRIKSSE